MEESIQNKIAREFPNLYHFGPANNRDQIERFRTIFSADLIRTMAGPAFKPPKRRPRGETYETPLGNFILNDQDALKYGHVKDPDSLPESDFVFLLDQLAFFWPGNYSEPIKMGRNFRSRYSKCGDKLIQVMVATDSFFSVNHPWKLFISTCNSGAPRSNPKTVIYRGHETFQPILGYAESVTEIKEIAVLGYARLPKFQLTEVENAVE